MGKRSDFPRLVGDTYQTYDPKAVARLKPFLQGVKTYAEPTCGDGELMRQLDTFLTCVYANDIEWGQDALQVTSFNDPDCIITNPPWSRHLLHPMIEHFRRIAPTWLLFDGDWAHTRKATPYLRNCTHIVSVGRLKWIPGSPFTGKDNVCWYRFSALREAGIDWSYPQFFGQSVIVDEINEEAA